MSHLGKRKICLFYYVSFGNGMSVKRFLEDLVLEKAPGPSPSFTVFDIIRVLDIISDMGSVGRGKLSEKLGLGEGATRTLLNRLTEEQLISTSKIGCALTIRGKKVWNDINAMMPHKAELKKNELTIAFHNVAVLVKDRGEKVKKGLEQRDAAVRVGAVGATTLVFKDRRLVLPTVSADVAKDYPKAFHEITSLMKLEENDIIIISSADKVKEAENGALAAAWTLV